MSTVLNRLASGRAKAAAKARVLVGCEDGNGDERRVALVVEERAHDLVVVAIEDALEGARLHVKRGTDAVLR